MRNCDGCRFCCWSFNIADMPETLKPRLIHCPHECAAGCSIYPIRPSSCAAFRCPYLDGDTIHRPDTFQFIEELTGNIGNYIPYIPWSIPVESAKALIRRSRSLPAVIVVEGKWSLFVIPLDRREDGTWSTQKSHAELWAQLFAQHDVAATFNAAFRGAHES